MRQIPKQSLHNLVNISISGAYNTTCTLFPSNQKVDPILVLISLMQQSLQQNETMIAQLNSRLYPHPPQTQSLSYQFKPQCPPFPK